MAGLYVHVPFCIRKCLYCDFYVAPLGTGPIADRLRTHHRIDNSRFLDALGAELGRLPEGFAPETVYIGGGTPTELSGPDFERMFDLLHECVDPRAVREWTIEANPGTLSREKADLMLRRGVNRVSLGVQTFHDELLRWLGRIHTAAEARATVGMLRDLGADNLNLDLIINLPGTDLDHLRRDVDELLALAPEHASCYTLDWTPGTHITDLRDRGFVAELAEDLARAQYDELRPRMEAAGLEHYELFNFARTGRRSQHNTATWRGGDYLGCGPSASSHWRGRRWTNVRDVEAWCRAQLAGERCEIESEMLAPEAKARELLMTSLRQMDGVERAWFRGRSGFEIEDLAGEALTEFEKAGWIAQDGERVRITEAGVYLSNRIFAEIV